MVWLGSRNLSCHEWRGQLRFLNTESERPSLKLPAAAGGPWQGWLELGLSARSCEALGPGQNWG